MLTRREADRFSLLRKDCRDYNGVFVFSPDRIYPIAVWRRRADRVGLSTMVALHVLASKMLIFLFILTMPANLSLCVSKNSLPFELGLR
jgi:hypothetical protein